MQIGCGVYEHPVRGRPYLYFWHYETRSGRRVQVNEYMGPAASPHSRERALHRCEAYFSQVAQELERVRAAALAALKTRR